MAESTSTEALLELIPTLTAQQREAVAAFIRYLKEKESQTPMTLEQAFEEFVSEHSELLRLLSQ